jgi:hypothetical protein
VTGYAPHIILKHKHEVRRWNRDLLVRCDAVRGTVAATVKGSIVTNAKSCCIADVITALSRYLVCGHTPVWMC